MNLFAGLFDTSWEVANRGARPDDNAKQRVRKAVMTLTAMISATMPTFNLLTAADRALYRSKGEGRNPVSVAG